MISVIVPVYNVEEYLSKCIDSILHQTYKDFELILIDDGSTDSSYQLCLEYAKNDARIRVFQQENSGPGKARNYGLLQSKGELIIYVDSDDWLEPETLQKMYQIMVTTQVDLVISGYYMDTNKKSTSVKVTFDAGYYDKNRLIKEVYPNMIKYHHFYDWGISPVLFAKLYKKDYLLKHQLNVDERITLGEDSACIFPLMLDIDSLYILEEQLYHYRQREGSLVREGSEKLKEKLILLYRTVLVELEKYKKIYDLTTQWREYIAYVLIAPRALWMYPTLSENSFLFPYPAVKKGSRVVIYGMGINGQLLYKFLKQNKDYELICCVDKNYSELCKLGLEVYSPAILAEKDFDTIIVTPSFKKICTQIYDELVSKYEANRIGCMDDSYVISSEMMEILGLN